MNPAHPPATARILLTLALAFILGMATAAAAQEDDPETTGNIYVPVSEPLVVNYGGPGRLKYLRAELSLRVNSARDATIVRHHMPLIRSNLVMLFSRQSSEDVNTQTGREQLRQLALEETNALLATEEGEPRLVKDLLFNNFVVQK